MFGRARTAQYMPVYHVEPGSNPYELEIALIDILRKDDVAVMACPGENRIAPWGELLTTASHARQAAGCVTDGLVRDVRLIREMNFPVFAGAIGPLDSKGRGEVKAIDVPIECEGAAIAPGDWIFGDVDGVVVIPGALCERAVELALAKALEENTVRAELAAWCAACDSLRPPRNFVKRSFRVLRQGGGGCPAQVRGARLVDPTRANCNRVDRFGTLSRHPAFADIVCDALNGALVRRAIPAPTAAVGHHCLVRLDHHLRAIADRFERPVCPSPKLRRWRSQATAARALGRVEIAVADIGDGHVASDWREFGIGGNGAAESSCSFRIGQ